ncbi:D-aminoacyl-tRNA deacylase [Patiriisocius sp. Uisw_017]|uniref:D-aminoacyl-tRNA deacylase n=1 Tax=Patiriisocius sp. Uisw_017 TaxID=3230968 RepID=UPI0039E981AA
MRIVIQRVSEASVTIENKIVAQITLGFLVLLGIETDDAQVDIDWLVGKITKLRVFSDADDAMNLSIKEVNGDIIVVSQFTLHASTKKGNRPSFIKAARLEGAIALYEKFVDSLETSMAKKIQTGTFGAMMDVALVNNGPVTIIIDSKVKE